MSANEEAREAITRATVDLIEQSGGDIRNITARSISERSGVSLGLINYHFGSKDELIALCCGRIINRTIAAFAPGRKDYSEEDGMTDAERLTSYAAQTFDFIYKNSATVKISVLSDLKDYTPGCNSAMTQKGFLMALREDIPDQRKKHIAFCLASIMQAAFLSGEHSGEITGYDLKTKKGRDLFIKDTVNMLMGGLYE